MKLHYTYKTLYLKENVILYKHLQNPKDMRSNKIPYQRALPVTHSLSSW